MSDTIPTIPARKHKIITAILLCIILVLTILLIVAKTRVHTFVIEKENAVAESLHMQKQLDSLLTEHDKMKKEYGNMTIELMEKDSAIQANAIEIQKLIASAAGRQQIQRKLDYLRGITQDYVDQIDKLLQENAELKTEIAGITENYQKAKEHSATLSKDKEELASQINKAAVLTAYNIDVQAIRFRAGNKEEIVDRARRTEKIKISFTVGRNPLVPTGLRSIYVRIARPDNAILHDGQSFEFDGKQIMYSLKETINYQQKPVKIDLYYEKTDRIVAGTYAVAIFSDDVEIGQAQLTLK
jgi:hypothetical protein